MNIMDICAFCIWNIKYRDLGLSKWLFTKGCWLLQRYTKGKRENRGGKKMHLCFLELFPDIFPLWSMSWVEHLKLHCPSSSFHPVILSREADISYCPWKRIISTHMEKSLSCYFPAYIESPNSPFPCLNSPIKMPYIQANHSLLLPSL